MSITSETQRKYDPNKGGFSYYTLFHADKGERPSWAQDGDMLEEFGEGGKAYVCSRDAKGRIKWTEKADWDRQTGGGGSDGGSLPDNFPAEGAENANKFIGFDNSGDYEAKDAPSGLPSVSSTDNGKILKVDNGVWSIGIDSGSSLPSMTGKNGKVLGVTLDSEDKEQIEWVTPPSGGGAEKFVVTLTPNGASATSDKTVAEILEALDDGLYVELLVGTSEAGYIGSLSSFSGTANSVIGTVVLSLTSNTVTCMTAFGRVSDNTDVWSLSMDTLVPIPSFDTTTDEGKVLSVTAQGLAWITPQ